MTDTQLKVLGIAGSLREKSYNRAVLQAAARDLVPGGMEINMCDIAGVPLYNDDHRADGFPAAVEDLRTRIARADGVLIATPEYNYSVPGVLKNAIDWASRPPEQPFDGKPVAILGASPGRLGTARAQYHLRQVFVFLNAMVMNKPEVMVSSVHEIFGEDGSIADQATADIIRAQLEAFGHWIRKVG